MEKTRFITNPRSGMNRKRDIHRLIRQHFPSTGVEWEVVRTEYAGHAVRLAKEAVEQGYRMVVACGGDGSVNEIASQLIGTSTILGVLPCGSGNGFAAYLGLGRDIRRALRILTEGEVVRLDTVRMNGRPFVNLAGIGFDAQVARRLHRSRLRGFWGYLLSSLREAWRLNPLSLQIDMDGEIVRQDCLLVEVANAPVYGYGFSIVPQADARDGRLDILVARQASVWRYLWEARRFIDDSFHQSPLVTCFQAEQVCVTPNRPTAIHLDGEGYKLNRSARFQLISDSLSVMAAPGKLSTAGPGS
ncbi:MAG: hypothetical protein RLY31_2108 [Bacteroidota bacterium]|jgi:YegS/Rv2252/BmrU family lipid kinase